MDGGWCRSHPSCCRGARRGVRSPDSPITGRGTLHAPRLIFRVGTTYAFANADMVPQAPISPLQTVPGVVNGSVPVGRFILRRFE